MAPNDFDQGTTRDSQGSSNRAVEIRWHGRGGQGAKTAATMVAQVAVKEGKYSQGFPDYGPERMGAPMRAYTRVSDEPILTHAAITQPDVVIVLDPTLMATVDVCQGLAPEGQLIVNTPEKPDRIREQLKLQGRKIYTINATQIALDTIGRPIPNMPMIGALVKVSEIIKLETIKKDVEEKFASKFSAQVVAGNLQALDKASEEVMAE